jgi:hypothetical protein
MPIALRAITRSPKNAGQHNPRAKGWMDKVKAFFGT